MAKKQSTLKRKPRAPRAAALPVPVPAPAPRKDLFLRASVLLMLAGMTYHLSVLDPETESVAALFAGLCAAFILYDAFAPGPEA